MGAGCDGRGNLRPSGLVSERDQGPWPDERLPRTAKSCGPGAATLASIPAGPCWRGNGDNKGRSPGRAPISRKAIARGKPGCPGCTCSSYPCAFCCTGGYGRSRRPAFPAPSPTRGRHRNVTTRENQSAGARAFARVRLTRDAMNGGFRALKSLAKHQSGPLLTSCC